MLYNNKIKLPHFWVTHFINSYSILIVNYILNCWYLTVLSGSEFKLYQKQFCSCHMHMFTCCARVHTYTHTQLTGQNKFIWYTDHLTLKNFSQWSGPTFLTKHISNTYSFQEGVRSLFSVVLKFKRATNSCYLLQIVTEAASTKVQGVYMYLWLR